MKAGWEIKALGDVCALQNGFAFKSKLFKPSGVPVLRISSIQNDSICDNRPVFVDPSDYKENLDKYKVTDDDLLIAMSGGTTGKVGFNQTGLTFLLNQRVGKFEPSEQLEKRYLYYYLSTKVQENLEISAGSAQPNLSTQQIKEFQIPLPPLAEQKRIVSILDEAFEGLDRARENAEANLESARELFDATLNSYFKSDYKSWPITSLGSISKVLGGKRLPKGSQLQNEETLWPYIRVADFDGYGGVDLSKIKYLSEKDHRSIARYTITSKDVFITIVGATIGKSGIVPEQLSGANLTENACKLVLDEVAVTKYVYFLTLSELFAEQVGLNTRTTAQPKLALNRLKTITLGLPPIEQQKQVSKSLEMLRAEIDEVEVHYRAKLQDISDLRQSLLQKAFAGELT